jgi:2'-5' RNA ligase
MGRRRFGVAVFVPRPVATEVDGLRRAFGDRAIGRIAPHITLVPPVNVRDENVADAVAAVDVAAVACQPFAATLGAADTRSGRPRLCCT